MSAFNALLNAQRSAHKLAVEKLGMTEARNRQLLWKILAVAHAAYHIACRNREVIAKNHAPLYRRTQMSACRQGESHLPHSHQRREAAMTFPLCEIVGVISVPRLSPHSLTGEVTVVLIVVTQTHIIIEIVFIGVENHLAIFIP